ncbi:MAG TPA: thiamine pyrophosphate-binding protein [Polyangia bacterium]
MSVAAHAGIEATEVRVADQLVDILIAHGVEVIFGLPGGPIGPVLDALLDRNEIRVVQTRTEAGALFAAAGYARSSGKLGVALVTTGPGVLNALTGLASAHCDGTPLLLLVGEVARRNFGRGALQDGSPYALQIVEILRKMTKYAAETHDPQRAPALLRHAIRTAMSGPKGPVALTLPVDATLAKVAVSAIHAPAPSRVAEPDDAAVDEVAAHMRDGGRGVIFVGSGVRADDGPQRLLELAERCQWPVMTTPKGKGVFPEDHPLSLGVFGMGGHVSATDYLEKGLDTALVVGTSLSEVATDGWSSLLNPRRAFIHVDVDESQLGRAYPFTTGVMAAAGPFFAKLAARLPQSPERQYGGVRRHVLPLGTAAGLPLHRAIVEIQDALPSDTIFTVDSGEHFIFATHYLQTTAPDSFLVMTGLGSMGQSIPAAVGAQLAQPDRVVAAICGDGCFAMNAFEVATAVAAKLPLVIFVINDGRLGMVEIGNTIVYGRTPSFPTGPMDIVKLAASLGARSLVADEFGDIRDAGLMALRHRGPVVVDVRIDPTVKVPKRDRFVGFNSQRARRVVN